MMVSVGCGGAKILEIACYVEAIVPIKKGGLTLIKNTSSNLPILFMLLFVISRKVSLRLEKIQRDFLLWSCFGDTVSLNHAPCQVCWNSDHCFNPKCLWGCRSGFSEVIT